LSVIRTHESLAQRAQQRATLVLTQPRKPSVSQNLLLVREPELQLRSPALFDHSALSARELKEGLQLECRDAQRSASR
jgi:hypothetical protein